MKIHLVVVRGRPEGKIIPLQTPTFRIGRGEDCHLRPNSEQVSRHHAEFSVSSNRVILLDLGSRNGTFVNEERLSGPRILKDGDIIDVGALAFAITIQGAAVPRPVSPPPAAGRPDDISPDDIESWLVSDRASPVPERPSGVYDGPTQMMDAPGPEIPLPDAETAGDEGDSDRETPVEAMDDMSNPLHGRLRRPPARPAHRDSSDAASDILKKIFEARHAARHPVK